MYFGLSSIMTLGNGVPLQSFTALTSRSNSIQIVDRPPAAYHTLSMGSMGIGGDTALFHIYLLAAPPPTSPRPT